MAQDVSGAVRGALTQTPISPPPPQPIYIPPPAPPTPRVQPPEPLSVEPAPPTDYRNRYPRDPRVTNWYKAQPTQTDYPLSAWQNDEEGGVTFRLDVNAKGEPTDCAITRSSGSSTLDAKTCEIALQRLKFRPAMEDAETPVAGTYSRSFYWRKREPELQTMSVIYQFVLDENGRASQCEILRAEGKIPESLRRDLERGQEGGDDCAGPARSTTSPYRDENGVPVARTVRFVLDVMVEDAPEGFVAPVPQDGPPTIQVEPIDSVRDVEVFRDPPPDFLPAPPPPPMAPPPPPPPPDLSVPAMPRNQARWASRFDYPATSAFLGEEGASAVSVKISPNGRVSQCMIARTSGFSKLDERACRMFRRYSRFNAARDRAGNPTEGSFYNEVRWVAEPRDVYDSDDLLWDYPDEARDKGLEGRVSVSFTVDPDGKISGCSVTASSGSQVLDEATCRNVRGYTGSKAVPTDDNPVQQRRVSRTIRWQLSE